MQRDEFISFIQNAINEFENGQRDFYFTGNELIDNSLSGWIPSYDEIDGEMIPSSIKNREIYQVGLNYFDDKPELIQYIRNINVEENIRRIFFERYNTELDYIIQLSRRVENLNIWEMIYLILECEDYSITPNNYNVYNLSCWEHD